MQWDQILVQTVITLLGSGAVGTAVGLIFKGLIERSHVRFQSELQAEREAGLERLKAVLRRGEVEHEVRFTRLHEKRLEVIGEMFGLLAETQIQIGVLFASARIPTTVPAQALIERTVEVGNRAAAYFHKSRIFLEEELDAAIGDLIDVQVVAFERAKEVAHDTARGALSEEALERWWKAWEDVKIRMPPVLDRVRAEARRILRGPPQPP